MTPISLVQNCLNSFFRPHYTQSFLLVTIVFQSSPTQKKVSNPLRLLVWTSPLTLSSLSYLLSLLPRKYPLIQLRLTKRMLRPYKLLTILQLQSLTSLLPPQLDYISQFPSLKTMSLKLQKHCLRFAHFCLTFDPFFLASITSFSADHSILGRQHRREYYTNHAGRTNWPRFNQHLQYCLKPEFCKRHQSFGIGKVKNIRFKAHFSPLNDS